MKEARYRIQMAEEDCIGCRACASVSDNWRMNEERGKAFFVEQYVSELGTNKEAAEGCPTQCIRILTLDATKPGAEPETH